MTAITRCPECGTRFKVTEAQLEAHEGLVRCGRCHEVFNARERLHHEGPSPQLALPIEPDLPTLEVYAEVPPAPEPEPAPKPEPEPAPAPPKPRARKPTLAQQVRVVEEMAEEVSPPPRKPDWSGILLILLLAMALLAQATYVFRVELAARLPGIKPLLLQYCERLGCTVPLPQKAELLTLESSELESDRTQASVVTLHALIHNRAPYAQAYPSLELTLTDLQNQTVARRVFHPADYLKAGADGQQGIPANRDLDIQLRLDTTDLKPAGYRLFLFYPH